MSRVRELFATILVAAVLGFSLSRIGFSSWDEVHGMFTFGELRMTLVFALGVAILAPSWVVVRRIQGATWPTRGVHKGTFVGGLLFGAGWALSGACPSIALVQLGEGQLAAVVTLLGILAGNLVYGVVHARFLRWDTGSCLDE